MKKLVAALLLFAVGFSLAFFGNNSASNTATPSEESSSRTEEVNRDSDPEYVQAVKAAYDRICAEYADDDSFETSLSAYMTDLNGDGYKDIVYQPFWFPYVMIYANGQFVDCDIESEVVGGSVFPSGKESGYFIDSEKGIIVIRYDSHTVGTVLYRGAEAFQIEGTGAKSLWIEYYDSEAHNGVEDYMLESEEYYEQVYALVDKEFDEKQYNPKIKDYNLINYYDVCVPWDGSVISGTAEKAETSNNSANNTEYLAATEKDFDTLSGIIQGIAYNGGWQKGFDCNKSDFSNDIYAVISIINVLYGSQEQDNDELSGITDSFPGLIDYNNSDSDSEENRKVYDPLFKFDDAGNTSHRYCSADAKTVEWIENELLSGNSPDKTGLINNSSDEDFPISCYYCDGHYYFQIWKRNGRIPQFSVNNNTQLEDGSYVIDYQADWYSTFSFKATAGLIEKDGNRYWKIFTIDWNLNDL